MTTSDITPAGQAAPAALTAPVAVLGATGAQGGPVVEALLAAGRPVRAVARSADKLAHLAARGIDTRAVDLADTAALTQAFEGVSGVFAHLPFLPVPELIQAWSRSLDQALSHARVPLTVFTLSGPPSSRPIGVASFDTKALAKAVLSRSSAPIVAFEPMGYLGNLSAFFSAPAVVHADELRYPLPAEHRQAWISVEDQAALAVAALTRPELVQRGGLVGKWLRIGQRLTGPELADGIGQARGSTVRYVPLDPDDFGRSLAPVMGPELGAALAADYRAVSSRPAELDLDADTTAAHTHLDVPPSNVADWARTQDWEAAAAVLGAP